MVEVLKYIHEHIADNIKIADVSKYFGYSKWYFCEKFRNYTGNTFVEYVRSRRMQLAALDILAGNHVADVAFAYGYESVSGFNKAFVQYYGCFPKKYKEHFHNCQFYYERRNLSMYQLTDRCESLRDEAVNKKSYTHRYCDQRDVLFTFGYYSTIGKEGTNSDRQSAAMAYTIEKFRPFIAPGELVVGFNFGEDSCGPIVNTEAGRERLRTNGFSDDQIDRFFEISGHAYDVFERPIAPAFTQEERDGAAEWAAIGRGIDSNHSVIAYDKVLKLGFEGLLDEVEKFEKMNPEAPLYRGLKKICKAAAEMGEKYADEAERLLASGDTAYNAEDLKIIAQVCRRVPRHPANSLAEAIQSIWFAHILNTWEDGINANSLGHLDTILYPYYKADLDSGRITCEQAFELICCLWIKLYRDYDVQQSCIGGTSLDGKSLVNELSYMMLDATEKLDFIRCLSVRFSSATEKDFLKRALEVVGHVQKGVPFFFNDDVIIPALISKGISPEDAYDYTQIGCVETVIPGKSNPHAVSGETNLLKAIEYVLGNGHSLYNSEFIPGVATGELCNFTTFAKFREAVNRQIEKMLDLSCSQVQKAAEFSTVVAPRPFKSLLTEGCLESGLDFNQYGAKYDYYQIMLSGVPNLADSLAVIKKFVYDEHKYTLEQIKEILLADFPDEAVRLEFVNKAPKYGNDIDEVDEYACDIINHSCDVLDALSEKYGLSFHAQPFTFLWMIEHGRTSAASPDGRRKGEIIAYSVSPMQGRDFNGLTAVLNSISKLPTKRTPGTTSAIVEVDPKLFTDANIDVLTDMLIASGRRGLSNVQFNVVDANILIDAQKHPEKYNNLAVRVSGFSQKFNLLSPELQNHIIGRTKHLCL